MTLSDMLRALRERRQAQEQQQTRVKQRVAAVQALREQARHITTLPATSE